MEFNVIQKTMEEVMHESMIPYSETVILDRPLPRVEDGLKPVQRRILFAMNELGTTPDKPYKKCARVVGDCLGKYHPHGDTSIYQALVRMAQPFNMSCPLVDGQGNFGDIDGNGAAAMRYTECRLTPLSIELMKGMGDPDDNIVKWNCNFDDTLKEPDMLPGRFPNLLVNGAYGIAIGFATNIPTHNLVETIDGAIAYIDKPTIKVAELMKYVKGPDFPTGGIIIAGDELQTAYETGKGKIQIRAKVHYEDGGAGKTLIVIDELPYQVNRSTLLQSIVEERDKRKGLLMGIADVVDESDRNGMRVVIKIKKDFDAKAIMEALFKYTNLQTSFSINMVAIADGKPLTLSLTDIYKYYVNYQREFIYKRSKCELEKAKKREHILEGLIVAVKNIDAVVKIIKNSQSPAEARENLKAKFALSDRQAEAILDLRLARLTHLEINKIEEELRVLRETIKRLSAIIASKKLQLEVVKKELTEIKKTYKIARKSEIVYSVENYVVGESESEEVIEDGYVLITQKGAIKRMSEKNFEKANRVASENVTHNDVHRFIIKAKSDDTVYLFTNLGNCYTLPTSAISEARWRERGTPIRDLVKDLQKNETIVFVYAFGEQAPEGNFLFVTREGMIKISPISEYAMTKSNFEAILLNSGDEVMTIEEQKADRTLFFVTEKGLAVNVLLDSIKPLKRKSKGVQGVDIATGDRLILATQVIDGCGEIIVSTEKGFVKRAPVFEFSAGTKGRRGMKLIDFKPTNGKKLVFASYVLLAYDVVFEFEDEIMIVNSEDINIEENRTHIGRPLKKNVTVVGAYAYKTDVDVEIETED